VKNKNTLLPRSFHSGRIQTGILEEVHKDGLVLLEYHIGDGKVPLQLVNFVDEGALEVVHVGPLARLVEELYEGELAGAEEAGQAHAVTLHHLFANGLHGGPAMECVSKQINERIKESLLGKSLSADEDGM